MWRRSAWQEVSVRQYRCAFVVARNRSNTLYGSKGCWFWTLSNAHCTEHVSRWVEILSCLNAYRGFNSLDRVCCSTLIICYFRYLFRYFFNSSLLLYACSNILSKLFLHLHTKVTITIDGRKLYTGNYLPAKLVNQYASCLFLFIVFGVHL